MYRWIAAWGTEQLCNTVQSRAWQDRVEMDPEAGMCIAMDGRRSSVGLYSFIYILVGRCRCITCLIPLSMPDDTIMRYSVPYAICAEPASMFSVGKIRSFLARIQSTLCLLPCHMTLPRHAQSAVELPDE